tara:strand:- start:28006 stop:30330 length:2325 start_codon:yes stop_codon:yes gene_type:complete
MQCGSNNDFTGEAIKFNSNWYFLMTDVEKDTTNYVTNFVKENWQQVDLPHTPKIEPRVVNDQWQGVSWYKKQFALNNDYRDKKLFLRFDGAMNIAEVWLNGKKMITHQGGYLPFTIDISKDVFYSKDNTITVKLNNEDNPITGPKPLEKLDFNTYGGIYRNVWLVTKNNVYITDPILENKTASGGVFVSYPTVTDTLALVQVKTHIRNEDNEPVDVTVKNILERNGEVVHITTSEISQFEVNADKQNNVFLRVNNPDLWSPENPSLYDLKTQVLVDDEVVDEEVRRIGIKTMRFEGQDFYLNGKKTFLRGVNRHQEYPNVGYALTDNANYRDAKKIKEAGFDYVRLSHYPQSPAFMDACDELGLVTINAILGWQYFSEDEAFQKHVFQTARDLIRRDRNRASVIAWEVSLNESWMPEPFIDELTKIAHEEYPGDQCFTAGWQPNGYDIYLQARQHRLKHYDPKIQKPYNVSEYGDWEYYAMNAGLNQDSWGNLLQAERSSRQLRGAGEKGLLQQALNIQEAHNDNFNTPAFADGYWVMFDYNRGYADDLEASGIMDLFRVPKFSYYFYKSQRDADHPQGEPMVYIANYWTPESTTDVRIFSNCDEVELFLNGRSLGKQKPDSNRISNNLNHPPFTFKLRGFEAGELKAIGYINGVKSAEFYRNTPGKPKMMRLIVDDETQYYEDELYDLILVNAVVMDKDFFRTPNYNGEVKFVVDGEAEIIGDPIVRCEAGIASVLVRVKPRSKKDIFISVQSEDLQMETSKELFYKENNEEN